MERNEIRREGRKKGRNAGTKEGRPLRPCHGHTLRQGLRPYVMCYVVITRRQRLLIHCLYQVTGYFGFVMQLIWKQHDPDIGDEMNQPTVCVFCVGVGCHFFALQFSCFISPIFFDSYSP